MVSVAREIDFASLALNFLWTSSSFQPQVLQTEIPCYVTFGHQRVILDLTFSGRLNSYVGKNRLWLFVNLSFCHHSVSWKHFPSYPICAASPLSAMMCPGLSPKSWALGKYMTSGRKGQNPAPAHYTKKRGGFGFFACGKLPSIFKFWQPRPLLIIV